MNRPRPSILGLIPARSGSKELPHKNILPLGGKPMIAWTVQAALGCPRLDRIVVTTNDWLIANIAQQWGAEAPFRRPEELAHDHADPLDAVLHALDWLETNDQYRPDYVMLLQPTSPLRSSRDIDGAIAAMEHENADSVVSVGPVHQHPALMRRFDDRGRLQPLSEGTPGPSRRQDFENTYALNGAIYLARRELLGPGHGFVSDQSYGFLMPPERSVDVDTKWDYRLAQILAGAQEDDHAADWAERPLLHCG